MKKVSCPYLLVVPDMSETFCQFNCLIPVVNKNKREIQYNIKSKKNLSDLYDAKN